VWDGLAAADKPLYFFVQDLPARQRLIVERLELLGVGGATPQFRLERGNPATIKTLEIQCLNPRALYLALRHAHQLLTNELMRVQVRLGVELPPQVALLELGDRRAAPGRSKSRCRHSSPGSGRT
jgi:hypothetical protein